jgi:hypothetical protein
MAWVAVPAEASVADHGMAAGADPVDRMELVDQADLAADLAVVECDAA